VSTVNKITNYTFNITIKDGLTSSGMITIYFPNDITPTLSTACAVLAGLNTPNSPTCVFDSSSRLLNIANLNSSVSPIPGNQTLSLTVLGVQNAPSIAPSDLFIITTNYTTNNQDIVSKGTISGVVASMDVIDSSKVSVVPSSYTASDTGISYAISFVNGNPIPAGGSIEVTVPSPIILDTIGQLDSCQISINTVSTLNTPCSASAI
jgi:hypothetical protein